MDLSKFTGKQFSDDEKCIFWNSFRVFKNWRIL